MSPRVKAIYVGDGEWIEPVARFGECGHPRDRLRFDSRFALPVACYCMACGEAYLHPFHGLTEQEIAAHKERVKHEYAGFWDDDAAGVSGAEAAERERDEAHTGYLREIDAIAERYEARAARTEDALWLLREFYELQQSPRSAVHADGPLVDKIDAALAALAAAAPGETEQTP
jgi:hypothetical protein